MRASSRGFQHRVLISRYRAIRQERLYVSRAATFRRQPGLDVFRAQIDDAAIVPGGRDIRGRFVGYRGEPLESRLLRIRPMRIEARDEHGLRRLWCELPHYIAFGFPRLERAVLLHVQADIFIEALGYHQRVVVAELAVPKLLEIVTARVVEAGKLPVVDGRHAGRAAVITHRRQYVLAVLPDDDAGVDKGKYPIVVRNGVAAPQVRELRGERRDLAGGNAYILARPLGFLLLQRAFRVHQACFLQEKILLQLSGHAGPVFLDGIRDPVLLIGGGIGEICLESARDHNARIVQAPEEQPLDLVVVDTQAELTVQLAGHLDDLGGVAHGDILPEASALRVRLEFHMHPAEGNMRRLRSVRYRELT